MSSASACRWWPATAAPAGAAVASTWLGYAIANIWCYVLGVAAASVSEPGAPLVGALLLAQGGLIALELILIDEMDNA